MNNGIPFFNPFIQPYNWQANINDIEKLTNKVERLEKNVRILENRLNKLEGQEETHNTHYYKEEPNDMYML